MNNRKSSIAPAALQAVLDASSNAAQKGQTQWHTPPEWGKVLALPLPEFRPDICDLTCSHPLRSQSSLVPRYATAATPSTTLAH